MSDHTITNRTRQLGLAWDTAGPVVTGGIKTLQRELISAKHRPTSFIRLEPRYYYQNHHITHVHIANLWLDINHSITWDYFLHGDDPTITIRTED